MVWYKEQIQQVPTCYCSNQHKTDISRTRIVWEQDNILRHDPYYGDYYDQAIYYENLATGYVGKVVTTTHDQEIPAIDGTRVVWRQDGKIYVKNFATGVYNKVQSSSHYQDQPAISGTRVVWTEWANNMYIYVKNLATGALGKVWNSNYPSFSGQEDAVISGTRIAWEEFAQQDVSVWVKNLITGTYGGVTP